MIAYHRYALLVALCLLSACAALPVAPTPQLEREYRLHAASIYALPGWSFAGRVAIRTEHDAGTVSLSWRQLGERYSLDLLAPWGAGAVQVEGGPGAVVLRTADGIEDFATEPAPLLSYYLGVDLPVEALRYWLLGVPDPAQEADYVLDQRGLIVELRQHGWRLDYRRYGEFAGRSLPTVVFMSGHDFELRVAIRQWETD